MADFLNTLYVLGFSVPAIYIALRLGIRVVEFWQRRAHVQIPALLVRDAIFFFCLAPFAGTVLAARIYEPLRQALRDNPAWQLATGAFIVMGTLVFAWYEHFVVGRRAVPSGDPHEDLERSGPHGAP